jgi:DNA-directed RNA polymerase specialized sigma24 family protein
MLKQNKQTKTIIVKNERIAVSRELYKAYHREREHVRYVSKLARKHEVSLEAFEEMGARAVFASPEPPLDDWLIHNELIAKLHEAVNALPKSERELIEALYFSNDGDGMTERKYAEVGGLPQRTINDRKIKILAQLKKILENDK